MSTAHHATIAAQLRLLVINNGRDLQGFSHPLETQYRNREGERGKLLYEALGNTILRLLRNIPGGTLVFWPSDSMMRAALDHWDLCGIKRALEQLVPVIQIDGPRMTADGSKTAMAKYRAAAAASTGTSCGALLLAVMRGRASEGTDFKDQAARGVIVVGLPLPPWQDAAVVMKRAYNDQRWKAADQRGPPDPRGGDAWYTNEGVRCAAQAIGRVIRHAGDYGTAILLDCRYAVSAPVMDIAALLRVLTQARYPFCLCRPTPARATARACARCCRATRTRCCARRTTRTRRRRSCSPSSLSAARSRPSRRR